MNGKGEQRAFANHVCLIIMPLLCAETLKAPMFYLMNRKIR